MVNDFVAGGGMTLGGWSRVDGESLCSEIFAWERNVNRTMTKEKFSHRWNSGR